MHDNNYLSDIEGEQNAPRYTPRPFPTPIPTARWDDDPAYCVRINDAWVSHIIGALELLDQRDTWIGTDAEIADARAQVNEIILAFMDKKACDEMACCPEPTNSRITDNGTMEVSYDGGTTWVTDPKDPRPGIPVMPPIVGDGSDKTKCDAATNGLEHLKDKQKEEYQSYVNSSSVTAVIIDLLVAFFGFAFAPELFPFWFPILIGIVQAMVGHTASEFDAMFTSDVWDAVLCILYCNVGDNGQFDQAGFNRVVAKCDTDIPGGHGDFSAAAHIRSYVKMWGLTQLNNACSYGNAADSDCGSCACAGCNIGDWTIFMNGDEAWGTIIDAGDDFITVQADLTPSGYEAALVSSDYATKCCKLSFEIIGGAEGIAYYHLICGENPALVTPHTGIFPTQCINFIQASTAATPFTIKYTFLSEDC